MKLMETDVNTGDSRYIRPLHPEGEKLRFNWNAARLHTLKCDKYKMSLPRAEARTAILQSIMTNLEAYCLPPLAASLDTFLQRLEDYSQDQSRLLEAVRALPKHNKARQLFDSGSLQWIDFVGKLSLKGLKSRNLGEEKYFSEFCLTHARTSNHHPSEKYFTSTTSGQ